MTSCRSRNPITCQISNREGFTSFSKRSPNWWKTLKDNKTYKYKYRKEKNPTLCSALCRDGESTWVQNLKFQFGLNAPWIQFTPRIFIYRYCNK